MLTKRGLVFKQDYKQARVENLYDTIMDSCKLRHAFKFYIRNNEAASGDIHISELGYGDLSFSDFMCFINVL